MNLSLWFGTLLLFPFYLLFGTFLPGALIFGLCWLWLPSETCIERESSLILSVIYDSVSAASSDLSELLFFKGIPMIGYFSGESSSTSTLDCLSNSYSEPSL